MVIVVRLMPGNCFAIRKFDSRRSLHFYRSAQHLNGHIGVPCQDNQPDHDDTALPTFDPCHERFMTVQSLREIDRLENATLVPGMPVEADLKTTDRMVMSCLLLC